MCLAGNSLQGQRLLLDGRMKAFQRPEPAVEDGM